MVTLLETSWFRLLKKSTQRFIVDSHRGVVKEEVGASFYANWFTVVGNETLRSHDHGPESDPEHNSDAGQKTADGSHAVGPREKHPQSKYPQDGPTSKSKYTQYGLNVFIPNL